MLDYVFFDQRPRERFVAFVRTQGLHPICREDLEGEFQVSVPDDLDDALAERIEAFYDEMLDYDRLLAETASDDASAHYHAAGVVLNLASGERLYAEVDPGLLARVMTVLSAEEFGRLVEAVVAAVENPHRRTLCQHAGEGRD
jgi:hypothetical protein